MSPNTISQTQNRYFTIVYHIIIFCSVLFLLFNHFFKNEKIAYVDSARILNEYKGSTEVKKTFQAKANLWQANVDTLTNAVKASIQQYEKSLATMTPKEQELNKELIKTKEKQLQDYQRAIQQNARDEDGKLTQRIVAEINAYLLKYGKQHHYKMILIANQSGTIAYAREGLDITSAVIEDLNNDYQGKK